jgi:hypothetical protein
VHLFKVPVDFINFLQYAFVKEPEVIFESIKVMENIFREQRHYISEVMQVMLPTDSFNIAIDAKQLLLFTLCLHTVMILLPAFAIATDRKVAF